MAAMKAIDYPFTHTVSIRFRDIDVLGHVNNAVYFTYLESARIHYLAELFAINKLAEVPVILGEAACRFVSPAFFGETLVIGIATTRFGVKSFEFQYQIDTDQGRLVATARTTMIFFDYQKGASIPVPAEFKQQVASLQAGWHSPGD